MIIYFFEIMGEGELSRGVQGSNPPDISVEEGVGFRGES